MIVTIDTKKCRCKETKLCASVCPYGFIWDLDENNYPRVKQALENYCIACGHCESICPTDAIKVGTLATPPFRYDKKIKIPAEHVELLLKTRRSVRTFKNTPLPRVELEDLLDIVRWIPTASNKQQVKWMVIDSKEKVQQISQLTIDFIKQSNMAKEIVEYYELGDDIILRNAPHLIIALGEKEYFWGSAEAGIALTYLELYAHAKGLGTCWAGFFTRAATLYQPLIEYLDLPHNHSVCGAIMLGHPVFKLHSIPFRKELDVIWR
ncbi:MAG: nitroreductase family protein [Proteobacteria bacterium]|nr:nitroreductase family protein [Pseudomonadota bacterium]MBU1583743.1 nitroreductase family protein [Pseudomonadota bacterium]MBU2456098.1 nitroreductase family protein [Pseudomonadota bacterium]MBU2631119.1 nitroreductase family protein [Pseudomonadota bacterium]